MRHFEEPEFWGGLAGLTEHISGRKPLVVNTRLRWPDGRFRLAGQRRLYSHREREVLLGVGLITGLSNCRCHSRGFLALRLGLEGVRIRAKCQLERAAPAKDLRSKTCAREETRPQQCPSH